ncbi:Glycosyl hydrolases family 31 [Pedobacter rhizosphaerae]|uniref:Glycosyl hydrolases family 31 n=1 Tax=Pedobacter rhizosphaerae TaxID=390241 RepID=A0A1H9VQB6_9SPHI|nr:Glycosyl hydrolases family 31 [Pedobacter rhizosphaerae]
MNYIATGNPYWTIDAGAFFVKSKSQWFWKGDFDTGTLDPGYREFYVRTLQFATWLPMMRSHGTHFAREPWKFGDVVFNVTIVRNGEKGKTLIHSSSRKNITYSGQRVRVIM